MTTAERLRALAFSIEQSAHDLRGFADLLGRGEVPTREDCRRIAGTVAALSHDAGEVAGLTGDVSTPGVEDASAALVAEVERPPDPPGRVTPNARPPTRTKAPES